MRKPLAVLAIVTLSLALAACGNAPTHVKTTHSARPTPSASPTPTVEPKAAEPAHIKPLAALTDPDILKYCPDIPAIHFDGKVDQVDQVDICTSVPSADGTKESASWVNFGQDALLSAYAQQNELVTGDDCAAQDLDPLIIWITGKDGKIYTAYAPVDNCGLPTQDAAAAYQSAGLQVLYEADLDANGKPVTQ